MNVHSYKIFKNPSRKFTVFWRIWSLNKDKPLLERIFSAGVAANLTVEANSNCSVKHDLKRHWQNISVKKIIKTHGSSLTFLVGSHLWCCGLCKLNISHYLQNVTVKEWKYIAQLQSKLQHFLISEFKIQCSDLKSKHIFKI